VENLNSVSTNPAAAHDASAINVRKAKVRVVRSDEDDDER
jgi:hypothetical protein